MFRQIATGLALVFACVTVHAVGLLLLLRWVRRASRVLQEYRSFLREVSVLFHVFVVVMALHTTQCISWALFYRLSGCFPDFEASLYFSLVSYTTVGYGDLTLPQRWRLLGGIEPMIGVLMFGWSTGYLWAVLSAYYALRRSEITGEPRPGG